MHPSTICPLRADHNRRGFKCGNDYLDRYIRQHAWTNQTTGYGRTFIAPKEGQPLELAGYYTLSMGSVFFANIPPGFSAGMPKYPMPVTHLGCLAVAADLQGKGIGKVLLFDAMERMISVADTIAARAIEVEAIDDAARSWYLQFGFTAFLDHPMHLYLPMETARTLVKASY